MSKKIKINGVEVGASSENVEYTNSSMSSVSNIKGAMDNIASRVSQLEQDDGGGSGGGSSDTTPSNIVLYALGDSIVTDNLPQNTTASVYRVLARLLNATWANYHNNGVGGQQISGLLNQSVGSDATHVFIQMGINDVISPGSTPFGDIDTILTYTLDTAESTFRSTHLGPYWLKLLRIRRDRPNAKVYCISPIYAHNSESNANLATVRNGIKKMVEALAVGSNYNKYHYIDGRAVGVNSSNYQVLTVDSTHLNKQGCVVVANHIYMAMKALDQSSIPDKYTLDIDKQTYTMSCAVGSSTTQTLTFTTRRSGNIGVSVMNASSNTQLSVSPTTFTASDGDVQGSVTITYTPTSSETNKDRYVEFKSKLSNHGNDSTQIGYVVIKCTTTN